MTRQVDKADLFLFEEISPNPDGKSEFKSECPPDKRFAVDNLFEFKRSRGDLQFSALMLAIALFFFIFFFSNTGWDARKLPDDFGAYMLYQLGLGEYEGRVTRFGRILKQGWVAPMLCLLLLVPAAAWNFRSSLRVHLWAKRFKQPTDMRYELEKYVAALEYVAYFILYTLAVPILGYLVSTVGMGVYLTWRLGYRNLRWMGIGFVSSFMIVIVFRTFLQIKTPVNIWLYDQLPNAMRSFMLNYF